MALPTFLFYSFSLFCILCFCQFLFFARVAVLMLGNKARARRTPSSSYVRDALLHLFLSGSYVCRKNEYKNGPHYVQRLRLPYQLEI